ncbi:spore germination cell wall hydrolase CwlJ-like protein [Methylobacterium brachiatum]|uniref:Spore germination cell wall hydrolase CwlJ-like protein n=1 Tax=Methylobacterium brachiatum TaxID=269660 RepID=A0AAJ1TQW4_9HYPH|nr:cell wall hydrolase [Methylobacterium brachiatum]MCB4804386.1 cell wall hydrolase [Methylobacterium brachiatum]MDQ0545416.1 spore germination cell wall hydrolase CwlJ-like protein [Methylobacterium brachiatum]
MLAFAGGLGACNTASPLTTGSIPDRKPTLVVSDAERDCLGRAMYFESNRSDEGGLIAVGTVVMNRLEAAIFPGGICAVVGQPGQFAPGVLTKPMQERDLQKVAEAADAVLAGERHPKVGKAMYFHTAGHHFPYKNMHYVAVAGGNAFYEKRDTRAAKKEMPASPALPPAVSSYAAGPVPPAQ